MSNFCSINGKEQSAKAFINEAIEREPQNHHLQMKLARLQLESRKYDLAIKAFNALGLPLYIAGTGGESKYLKSMAKDNISFLGKVPDAVLKELYSNWARSDKEIRRSTRRWL
jgi:predicted TPR repeat methyltransferase